MFCRSVVGLLVEPGYVPTAAGKFFKNPASSPDSPWLASALAASDWALHAGSTGGAARIGFRDLRGTEVLWVGVCAPHGSIAVTSPPPPKWPCL